jgi:hypothetical protein
MIWQYNEPFRKLLVISIVVVIYSLKIDVMAFELPTLDYKYDALGTVHRCPDNGDTSH